MAQQPEDLSLNNPSVGTSDHCFHVVKNVFISVSLTSLIYCVLFILFFNYSPLGECFFARPIKSFVPLNKTGIDFSCIAVGVSKPNAFTEASNCSFKPKSAKLAILKICANVI